MRIKARVRGSFLLFLSLALAGCGGGNSSSGGNNSGGGGSTSTPGQAQGVYEGSTSTGLTFDGIILPTDKFYAIYGTTSNNAFFVCGMATGPGSSASGKYNATETDFDYCGGSLSVFNGTVGATYVPGSSINGSITEGGSSDTFSGTAPSNSLFNYNSAASLSAISGSWSGSLTDGESAAVNIDSLGKVTGTSSDGCSFSATITPDNSGKDFFDVSLTFGSSPCSVPNQSATGIAVDYLLSDGVTNQLIAGVSSGNAFGIVFAAQR